MMTTQEVAFNGIVGPTHNYGGLSLGNVASHRHARTIANPREAALQGLQKMRFLGERGIPVAVLPPHERPCLQTLRRLGFAGKDEAVLRTVLREAPRLLEACSSASAMWTANAATVSPSADTSDGRVHFTPANLSNKFHRSIEWSTTARILQAVFPEGLCFAHHPALPSGEQFSDEGAANHTRFCGKDGSSGVEFFVFGRSAFDPEVPAPQKFPARQTWEASHAIARLHGLAAEHTVFAQQHPDAIDAGVFHNDVIAVGNRNVLLHHECAFLDQDSVLAELDTKLGNGFQAICVPETQVSLDEAVRSYLFNSELLSLDAQRMALIAPSDCEQVPSVQAFLEELQAGDNPIVEVHFLDLRQSMQNGGGPACLRLRVVLNAEERAAANPKVFWTPELDGRLTDWVNRHYRDRLEAKDLGDPELLNESRTALDELSQLLGLGSVYPFQEPATPLTISFAF